MAKEKVSLQEYQQDILSRLKASAEGGYNSESSRLAVKVGAQGYLFSLADISETLAVPEIQPVPLTRSWFLGLTNVRGNLYALADLGNFIGGAPSTVNSLSRVLLLHARYGMNTALLVDRLIGLRSIDDMKKQKKEKSSPAWHQARYADENGDQWEEIDLGRLIGQDTFMQVAA